MLELTHLRCDDHFAPFGLSTDTPTFGWILESDRNVTFQRSYAITLHAHDTIFWDTGVIISDESTHIRYEGQPLEPHRSYRWTLTVTDSHGETATAESTFYSGKMKETWKARWIATGRRNDSENCLPPEIFQRRISLRETPVLAVLYASALGIYEAELNGIKVGDIWFAPGYTHYQQYVQFQAYDVTSLVRAQENVLRFTVANGWYMGTIVAKNNFYGDQRALIAELHLFYGDGTREVIQTDEQWKQTTSGPVRYADFYNGQTTDMTLDDAVAESSDVGAGSATWVWDDVVVFKGKTPALEPHFGAFVKAERELTTVSRHPDPNGKTVFDMGQNFAGVVKITVSAKRGTTIILRHAEILNRDGSIYTENLRSAKAQLTWICGVNGEQTLLPRFTFMGFRYVSLTADQPVEIVSLTGMVLTSDARPIGEFSCSEALLTKLQQNIQWGQCSNFIEIPTDCPQRNERIGWTGDIAVFASTASFNRDTATFMRKWLRDLRSEQGKDGLIPFTIPDVHAFTPFKLPTAGWGDAATMVPWATYLAYGDKGQLRESYDSMRRWTEAERRAASLGLGDRRYLWDVSLFQFGDWCAPGEGFMQWKKKGKWLATAYFANSVDIMRKAAAVLGYHDDVDRYSTLHEKICRAFNKVYLKPDGKLDGDFQSNYVCALYFGLLPESERPKAARRLAELVEKHDDCIATGFLGTPYITFALADHGQIETAFRLLMNRKSPGWLYTVLAGGTTIWERWDALDEHGQLRQMEKGSIADMISFNHYAYGAVGDFFYRRIVGIEAVEAGYRRFGIRPIPGEHLTSASGSLMTRYGLIKSEWRIEEGRFEISVQVPVNTRCTVTLPDGSLHDTGSGSYQFQCKMGVKV